MYMCIYIKSMSNVASYIKQMADFFFLIVFLIVLEYFVTLLEYYFSALYFGQFGK